MKTSLKSLFYSLFGSFLDLDIISVSQLNVLGNIRILIEIFGSEFVATLPSGVIMGSFNGESFEFDKPETDLIKELRTFKRGGNSYITKYSNDMGHIIYKYVNPNCFKLYDIATKQTRYVCGGLMSKNDFYRINNYNITLGQYFEDVPTKGPSLSNNGGEYSFGYYPIIVSGKQIGVLYRTSANFDFCQLTSTFTDTIAVKILGTNIWFELAKQYEHFCFMQDGNFVIYPSSFIGLIL